MIRSRKAITRRISRILCLRTKNFRSGIVGGFILFILVAMIRFLSGSPYRVYMLLRQFHTLPPLVLLSTINLLLTVAMGIACGLIFSVHKCGRAGEVKYQSGMLFVILITLWLGVYPLIFRSCMLGCALLLFTVIWGLSLICFLLWRRIHRISSWIALLFTGWITYLIILLIRCILQI